MKNQLQGIALILFAGMLMLYAPLSPWLPILGSLPSDLISLVGLAFAIRPFLLSLRLYLLSV